MMPDYNIELDATADIFDIKNIKNTNNDDFIQQSMRDYDAFNTDAWNKKHGYSLPKFPFIEKQLEGMERVYICSLQKAISVRQRVWLIFYMTHVLAPQINFSAYIILWMTARIWSYRE